MKLLQINTVINSGSTGRIAEEIGKLAVKKGWDSYIAYGRNDKPSSSKKIKIGNKWSVYSHVIKTRLFDLHGFGSKNATKKFIKQIKDIKPDIIHLHNIHGYYLNIELLFNYLSKANIPIIWTLHDCWAITGHCAYFDYIGCEKWAKLCCSCPQKQNYPKSLICDSSRQNYIQKKALFTSVPNLTIVPVSIWLNSLLSNSFLSHISRKVIPNGVDTNLFFSQEKYATRQKLNIDNDSFILIGVASIWEKRKGLMDFIELSKRVENDVKIILVGVTESQKKILPKNIIGINRTENQKELAELYSAADVVLNLSYEETFGLTTIEGFACGTPCIVYDRTASPELITNDTGIIVQAGSYKELISAINTIKEKGKLFYTDACRKRAIGTYNKNKHYATYIDLYESLHHYRLLQ